MSLNILVYNIDKAGVGYYRQTSPHIKLSELYDDVNVEFISDSKIFDDEIKLKNYQIVQFHRNIISYEKMPSLINKLKKLGIKTVMDLDDYWDVPKNHPAYYIAIKNDPAKLIIQNIKMVDMVTTTTEIFKKEIIKYNKNCVVIPNSIDPDVKQYQILNKNKGNKIKVGIVTGSSHLNDIYILKDSFNRLNSDNKLNDKIQVTICGFDLRGQKRVLNYITKKNQEFFTFVQQAGGNIQQVNEDLKKVRGDLFRVKYIPRALAIKYKNLIPEIQTVPIPPTENVWYEYEKILTTNHKNVNSDYNKWLHSFQQNNDYPNIENMPYQRHFTLPVDKYATHYNNIDIHVVPLLDNKFNNIKSELKMIESGFFKKPTILSDIQLYRIIGKHGENCLLVDHKKNHKDWYKNIKNLIQSEQMRIDLGEKLYETVKDKYNLNNTAKYRYEVYKNLIK